MIDPNRLQYPVPEELQALVVRDPNRLQHPVIPELQPASRAVVLLLLLIDLCDRTTIFQSQPRLPKPNQRLPLLKTSISTETTTKTSTSTETSTKTSISTESSTKTFTSIETSTKTSTTSATAILWLRACSGYSLSSSLLFLCDHTTGRLSAHLTGSGLWSHLPLSDGKT